MMSQINRRFLAFLACLGLVGVAATWVNTPWGVRVGYDSYFYLSAAQNVLRGLGISRLTAEGQVIPLTHFPPLYSLMVAGFSYLVNGDIFLSSRWTAVILFGINIFFFGIICYRYTRSETAGICGAFFCLISPILLTINISAFSEGLYLTLLLSALILIDRSLAGLEWHWLFLAGVFTALSCLTRYVGSTLILAGLLAILFLNQNPMRKKIGAAGLFGLTSVLPLMLWFFRNWWVSGSTTNRTFGVHLPGKVELIQAMNTSTTWIVPEAVSLWVRLGILGGLFLLIGAAYILWGQRLSKLGNLREDPAFRFSLLLVLYGSVYVVSLVVSRSFFDSSTRWELRILSPLYILSALLAWIVLWNGFWPDRFAWRKIALAVGLLVLFAGYLPLSIGFLNESRIDGGGFIGPAWKNSPTMQVLKRFPPESIFTSNNATAIYFVLGRPANGIPERYDGVKAQFRQDYAENLAKMRQILRQPNTALVIFIPYRDVLENPPLEELTEGLVVFEKTEDGTVYVNPNPNP